MNSSSSERRSERFFMGKGFYIVLFLCAAVIGVSAWVMATGNETMKQSELTEAMNDRHRVETVIAPSNEQKGEIDETQFAPPAIREQTPAEPEAPAEAKSSRTVAPEVYVWPASGAVERAYSVSALRYDATMRDWRTHSGIDISAAEGSQVLAARGGQVVSIVDDGLYGTMLTIDHGDGVSSVYANLEPQTAVGAGEWVDAGVVIGTVGRSALCEIGQEGHLHFEMHKGGASVDPMAYLPAAEG